MLSQVKKLFSHKVVQAGSWYTLSNFFVQGVAFLTLPLFTRLLTPEHYGVVSLFDVWMTIFAIVVGLSLHNALPRGWIDFKEDYQRFSSSLLALSFFAFLVFIAVLYLLKDFLIPFTGLPESLFFFMAVTAYFSYAKNFFMTKSRYEYRYKAVSLVSVLMILLGVAASIYLILNYFQGREYLGRIYGKYGFLLGMGLFLFVLVIKRGKTLIHLPYWKYGLMFSLPMIFNSLAGILNNQFDRILINRFIGNEYTGIYSFACSAGLIVNVLKDSLYQAWQPWFFDELHKKNFALIKKRSKNFRDVFTLLFTAYLLLSPEIIKLMAHSKYWEGIAVLPWIGLGYYFLFLSSFEISIFSYHKKNFWIAAGTVVSGLSNIFLNIIFIPKYGINAAAITTAVAYFIYFLFYFLINKFAMKNNLLNLGFYLKAIFFAMFIVFFSFFFRENFKMRIILFLMINIFSIPYIKKMLKSIK